MDPADPLLPKILVLVILILINAFFAAAEIAVISLSETKLRKQAEEGDKKAKKLLVLMQAPDSFLSAIQIAITLAGFLSSAFAADSFSDPLVHWLTVDKGFTAIPTSTLNTIMVVLITIVLSYFSLVLGELVPKRIAMKKTEAVARFTVGDERGGGVPPGHLAALQVHERRIASAAHRPQGRRGGRERG